LKLLLQTSHTIFLQEGIMHTLTAITLRYCLRFSLLFLALPLPAHASLPQSSNVPGGVAVVPLGGGLTKANAPLAWFRDQAVLVTSDHKR